jgi:hypothetical protein
MEKSRSFAGAQDDASVNAEDDADKNELPRSKLRRMNPPAAIQSKQWQSNCLYLFSRVSF